MATESCDSIPRATENTSDIHAVAFARRGSSRKCSRRINRCRENRHRNTQRALCAHRSHVPTDKRRIPLERSLAKPFKQAPYASLLRSRRNHRARKCCERTRIRHRCNIREIAQHRFAPKDVGIHANWCMPTFNRAVRSNKNCRRLRRKPQRGHVIARWNNNARRKAHVVREDAFKELKLLHAIECSR